MAKRASEIPITDIKTVQDAVRYWRVCLGEWGEKPDDQIATSMVCIGGSDYFFDELYRGEDGDFSKLFELAADLEWDYTTSDRARAQVWNEVRVLLKRLEERYLK